MAIKPFNHQVQIHIFKGSIQTIHIAVILCGILIEIEANSRNKYTVSLSVIFGIEIMEFLFVQNNFIIVFEPEIQMAITIPSKHKGILYILLPIIVYSMGLNDCVAMLKEDGIQDENYQIYGRLLVAVAVSNIHVHYNHAYC